MNICGRVNGFRLLAVGHCTLVIATWPLWTPQTAFPQIPLISIVGTIPRSLEWGLLAALVVSLAAMVFVETLKFQRWGSLMMGLSTLGLVVIDQHRLQPWAWQFLILSVVLATAQAGMAYSAWRCLVIGIYAWSASSKMDHSFCVEHGPFLLDGFCRSIGLTKGTQAWPTGVRYAAAAAIPIAEFLIAGGLCWQRSRRYTVIATVMMHLALVFALGPFGHGHQPGVLLWNVFFLVQNWWLFVREPAIGRSNENVLSGTLIGIGNWIARSVVGAALAWPLLEPLGLCDHWLAWAVYAARPERVQVFLDDDDVRKLPLKLQPFVGAPDFEGWHPFRIDRWSLDAVDAPTYPQDRFQVGVTLWLAHNFNLQQVRVVIESPANRWSGKRTAHEYIGLEPIQRLAATYRVNAFPSQRR